MRFQEGNKDEAEERVLIPDAYEAADPLLTVSPLTDGASLYAAPSTSGSSDVFVRARASHAHYIMTANACARAAHHASVCEWFGS